MSLPFFLKELKGIEAFLLLRGLNYARLCTIIFFEFWILILVLPFLSSAPLKKTFSSLSQNTLVCPHCYQWLQPDNHHMRLRPKRRPSARVQSILFRKARGKRLSLTQRNLLHRFQKSSSVLVRRHKTKTPRIWLRVLLHCGTFSLQKKHQGYMPELWPQLW